ncbi:MAG TPA: SRPBCC family protein [Candidatus Limnocylindrales bacterium]|nr:SRPBCC family protein [Candidatus Limnocylindrales bacterium]
MPTIHETIETDLEPDAAFDFVADFANAPVWDPGTATAQRIDDGPVDVGARYRLGVRIRGRVAPMEYRIVVHEAPHRVVLEGEGSGVHARDDITFAPRGLGGGTRIDYVAEIHLTDWKRILAPLLGGAFAKIGRDARDGMRRALDELALDERTRRVATVVG